MFVEFELCQNQKDSMIDSDRPEQDEANCLSAFYLFIIYYQVCLLDRQSAE